MTTLWNKVKMLFGEESGQTGVEYALLLALIALAIVAVTPAIRSDIQNIFSAISSGMAAVAP